MTDLDVRALVRAAFAAGSANTANAASEILEALRPATGHEAGAILAWEPRAREHIVLASTGYDPHTLASLGEPYAASREHRLECALKTALRIDDIPYDYRASDTFRKVLAPAGFDDGMTICMFAARSEYADASCVVSVVRDIQRGVTQPTEHPIRACRECLRSPCTPLAYAATGRLPRESRRQPGT